MNLAVHTIAALVAWVIVAATVTSPPFAGRFSGRAGATGFAAALVWMAHPVHEETIVYLTQRTDLQMGLSYLLTLWAAIAYWRCRGWQSRLALAAVAAVTSVTGMLSKEMMASVPAVLALYEWTFLGGAPLAILRRSWPLYLGVLASLLPLGVLYARGAGTPLAGFNNTISAHDYWLTQSGSFFVYWRLLFWPMPLLLHYQVPTLHSLGAAWPAVVGLSAYVAVTAVAVWYRRPLGFSLASFFLVLSPTLIVPLPHEEIAERRMYVASLVVLPFLTISVMEATRVLATRVLGTRTAGRVRLAVAGSWLPTVAVTALSVGVVVATVPRLATRSGLWDHVLAHQPDNALALAFAGWQDYEDGAVDAGIDKVTRAWRMSPGTRFLANVVIAVLDRTQRYPQMLSVCRTHHRNHPRLPAAVQALAVALEKNGRVLEAIDTYREVIRLKPDAWDAHSALATLLAENGAIGESIEHFAIATDLHPDFMNCMNLFSLYRDTNHVEAALAIAPRLVEAARRELPADEAEPILRDIARYDARRQQMDDDDLPSSGGTPERHGDRGRKER
ncbi:MAG: hypothetical protein FJ309_01650 [Planctomycetes bacterium]|nr:hypothetical protein [Planctomycetota bacterium]